MKKNTQYNIYAYKNDSGQTVISECDIEGNRTESVVVLGDKKFKLAIEIDRILPHVIIKDLNETLKKTVHKHENND